MNELKKSIEQLYRVFANYPLVGHVEGCPCCVDAEDKEVLISAQLRELTAENLNHYSRKAMTTWGGVHEFKHFLPRIFELALNARSLETDIEVVMGKLPCAEWQAWPEEEREAVKAYLLAGWKHVLFSDVQHIEPSEWLCGVGIAGEDLRPYLDVWVSCKSKAAYEQLMDAVVEGWILQNTFWADALKAQAQVIEWMGTARTVEKLEKVYFENEEAEFARPLRKCIDVLSAYQK